jgi:hypothetical protein
VPVPVEGSINLGVSLALEGAAHVDAQAQVTITGGANLHGVYATPILRVEPSASGQVAIDGGKLSIGPQMQVGIGVDYVHAAEVNAHIADSLALAAKASTPGSCEIDIDGSAGVGADLWSLHASLNPINPEVVVWRCPPTPAGGAGSEAGGGPGETPASEEGPVPPPPPLTHPWSEPLTGLPEQLAAPAGYPVVQTLTQPAPQPQWQAEIFSQAGMPLFTLGGQSGSSAPPALAADGSGYAALTDSAGEEGIERIGPTGQVAWTHPLGTGAAYALVIGGDGNAYVDYGERQVIGLDARTGAVAFDHDASAEEKLVRGIVPEPGGVAVIEESTDLQAGVVLFLNTSGSITHIVQLAGVPAGDYRLGTTGQIAHNATGELFLTMLEGGGTDCEHRGQHPATSIVKIAPSGVQWSTPLAGAPDPCYLTLAALPNGGVTYTNHNTAEQAIAALTSEGTPAWSHPIDEATMSLTEPPLVDSDGHVDVLIYSEFECADHAPESYCDGQLFEDLNGATGQTVSTQKLLDATNDRSVFANCADENGFALGDARFYLLDWTKLYGEEGGCETNKVRLEGYPITGAGAPYPPPTREHLPQ